MIIKESKNTWTKIVLREDNLIKTAIEKLNFHKQKIILVVSNNKKLVGTITDGDIRRGFIKGLTIKNKLKQVKNTKYLFVNSKASSDQARQLMIDKREKKLLKKHKKHHSTKHMAQMKKDMKKGMTFKKSHNKAMRKVGK